MPRRSRAKTPRRAARLPIIAVGPGVVALVGVALWVVVGSTGATSGGPGRLVAAQPAIDLGRVPFDRQVDARFELENTGSQTVRLVGAPTVKTLEGC